MKQVEDRTSHSFKAEEQSFYSDQWAYNTRMEEEEKIIANPNTTQEEKEAALTRRNEIAGEKVEAIENWKDRHGEYDEEMTKWNISEAVEHEKDGSGLGALQNRYDENQYGHADYSEDEYETEY